MEQTAKKTGKTYEMDMSKFILEKRKKRGDYHGTEKRGQNL